jgi:hypothetical protein
MTRGSTLTLAANISEVRLTNLVREFCRDLTRSGIEARAAERPNTPGERGDAAMLGQIALGLITSGAVTALIECLKVYIARERTITMRVKHADGLEVDISAKNVDDPTLRQVLLTAFPRT